MQKYGLQNIDDFLFELNKILKLFSNVNHDFTSVNYLIDNCYRSYDILISIDCLNKNVNNLKEIEHPIGILLRSGLYDFINLSCYLNKCISKNSLNKEEFNKEVDNFKKGHLNKLDWDSDLKDKFKDIIEIKKNGKVKEFKPLGILKEGVSISIAKKLDFLQEAIKSWEWYSKYEHYGLFTNTMLSDFEGNLKRINFSIEMLYANVYFSLLAISDIDSRIFDLKSIQRLENIVLNE